jgi:hypothetical protein
MPETPLAPTPVIDVLLRQGEFFSKRGKRGFLAAATVTLAAAAVIIYFTVFPIPRLGGRAQSARTGPPLDQAAVAVTNSVTKLGWNEHNCRAAGRYSVGPKTCPSTVLPAGSYTFVLNTWLIQPHCLGHVRARPTSSLGRHPISPGCIQYTAANGEKVSYTMAKLPEGWRVVGVHASRGAPIPNG